MYSAVSCEKCGAEIAEDSQFCRKCGHGFGMVSGDQVPKPLSASPQFLAASTPFCWLLLTNNRSEEIL